MKHKHTGKIRHKDMGSLHASTAFGGKDKHAHPSHHEMNKMHGTPMGFQPEDESDSEGGSTMSGHDGDSGGSMTDNCCDED